MSGQQFRRDDRRPAADVPFFAPTGGGEFTAPAQEPSSFGSAQFGSAQFGSAQVGSGFGAAVPDARFGPAAVSSTFGSYGAPRSDEPVHGLEPVATLGRTALVLAVVVAATALLGSLASLGAAQSLPALLVAAGANLASYAALVANWFVVSIWLSRAIRNARRITPRSPQRRGAVWAWLGWVLPIVWLFYPFQAVGDVWRASRRRAPHGQDPKVGLWWAAWLGFLVLSGADLRFAMEGQAGTALVFTLASTVAGGAALVLFAGVVRAVVAAQAPEGSRR